MSEIAKFLFGKDVPEAVNIIKMTTPNERVLIEKGNFVLKIDCHDIPLTGEISFRWVPDIMVAFEGTASSSFLNPLMSYNKQSIIELYLDGEKVADSTIPNVSYGSKMPLTISGIADGHFIRGDKSIPTEKVTFSVPNFVELFGEPIISKVGGQQKHYHGRIVLECDDYTLVLDKVHDYKERKVSLKSNGGYLPMYSGELVSKKAALLWSQIDPIFDCLSSFLSFLNGRRTAALFQQGKNGDETAWQDFTPREIDIYKPVETWVIPNETEGLGLIWQNFFALWKSKDDADFLTLAIHWYVEANLQSGFIEGAIIKAQTALELIYNWLLIEQKKLLIGKDAESISASNKIRLLLSQLQVSHQVPDDLINLKTIIKDEIIDGPEAFVQIRNAIVHSKNKKRKNLMNMDIDVKFEALSLGIWYIELSLLYILGYRGKYSNRTVMGFTTTDQEQTVPWAKKD